MTRKTTMPEWYCRKCGIVYQSVQGMHCGQESEAFDPDKHDWSLIANSNAWISVWDKWKKHPLLNEISVNLAYQGCFGASETLNEFIEELLRLSNRGEAV